jgi:hypothetical protein
MISGTHVYMTFMFLMVVVSFTVSMMYLIDRKLPSSSSGGTSATPDTFDNLTVSDRLDLPGDAFIDANSAVFPQGVTTTSLTGFSPIVVNDELQVTQGLTGTTVDVSSVSSDVALKVPLVAGTSQGNVYMDGTTGELKTYDGTVTNTIVDTRYGIHTTFYYQPDGDGMAPDIPANVTNMYRDFNELYDDMSKVAGYKVIIFDDTYGTSIGGVGKLAVIPPRTGGGVYDFTNTQWSGPTYFREYDFFNGQGNNAYNWIWIDPAVRMINLGIIDGVAVYSAPSTAHIMTVDNSAASLPEDITTLRLVNGASLTTTTGSSFSIVTVTNNSRLQLVMGELSSLFRTAGMGPINVENGGRLEMVMTGNGVEVRNNTLSGGGTGDITWFLLNRQGADPPAPTSYSNAGVAASTYSTFTGTMSIDTNYAKTRIVSRAAATGTSNDIREGFIIGDIWFNTTSGRYFTVTSNVPGNPSWVVNTIT